MSIGGEPFRDSQRLLKQEKMLTEFDQNTVANIAAVLEYVCNKDRHELRKCIADVVVAFGHDGRRMSVCRSTR